MWVEGVVSGREGVGRGVGDLHKEEGGISVDILKGLACCYKSTLLPLLMVNRTGIIWAAIRSLGADIKTNIVCERFLQFLREHIECSNRVCQESLVPADEHNNDNAD